MKRGQVVTIYEDPVTENKVEGHAKLIKPIRVSDPELEYWEVEFPDDYNRRTYRWIKR